MTKNPSPEQLAELQRIFASHGLPYPPTQNPPDAVAEDMAKAAMDPQNPLHSLFAIDPDEAAHRYRLQQAKQLIEDYHAPRARPNSPGEKLNRSLRRR